MKRRQVKPPVPTGDADVRLERLTGSVSAGKWYDITSNTNDGTPTYPAELADFGFNQAYPLNPGWVTLSSLCSANSDSTQAWTICIWSKSNRDPLANSVLCATRNPVATSTGWTVRDFPSTGQPDYMFSVLPSGANYMNLLPDSIGPNWHFFALTYEPGVPGTATGFSDGAQYHTLPDPNGFVASTSPMRIMQGAFSAPPPGNAWKGWLDTFRVYPRVLSADEILRDYHAGKPAHP